MVQKTQEKNKKQTHQDEAYLEAAERRVEPALERRHELHAAVLSDLRKQNTSQTDWLTKHPPQDDDRKKKKKKRRCVWCATCGRQATPLSKKLPFQYRVLRM